MSREIFENFIFKCIHSLLSLLFDDAWVKYRMIKIEKYQIYEDECFDELLLRFFNFFTIKLRMFMLHLNLYGYDFLNGAGREERKVFVLYIACYILSLF